MSAWLQPIRAQRPALWTFAVIWGMSALWLAWRGRYTFVLAGLAVAVLLGAFCALTLRWTEPAGTATVGSSGRRTVLGIQLFLLALIAGVTLWRGLRFHHVVESPLRIPLWSAAERWFGELGERWLDVAWVGGPAFALANPAQYFLLPLLFLLPLTGLRYLGLDKGHRVWRVMALWCVVPAGYIVYQLATGRLPILTLAQRLVSNTLQNGPFEEFLFRGAIQSRLTGLLGSGWGVVVASLAFGVWHLGLGYTQTGGHSLLDGLASTVLLQATTGLGFGVIFHRTRNLLAGSVFHVVSNSMG